MWKKFKCVMFSILLAVSALAQTVSAASAPAPILPLENDFVKISVHQDNGRFSIRTNEGHPLRVEDQEQPLLFQHKVPDTSFTTFRINGQDYIYGNDYGFFGSGSQFLQFPSSSGLMNQSVWQVEGLEITQTLTLVGERENPNVGNVKISYQVTNTTDQPIDLGTRILLDTMLGAADASPITLAGSESFIRTEQSIDGETPLYWRAADQQMAPKVMSYGFLHGWNNLAPDRMVVAHWEGISRTKWDYEIDEMLDFTSRFNKYGSADSAVALYWSPNAILPDEQKVYETYYGLGSFVTSLKQAKFASQIMAIKQLDINAEQDGYVQEEFEIRLELDNTTSNAESLYNVKAEISLQPDLALTRGENAVRTVHRIGKNDIHTFTWKVMARPQTSYKAAQYWVQITAEDTEEVIHSGFVVLPALSGDVPDVQIHDMLPDKLYRNDEQQILYIKGAGFEALRGNWDAEVELVRERDGSRYPIDEFDVIDDKQIVLDITPVWEGELPEPGQYTIIVDAGVFGKFSKSFEITEDKRYQSKNYGILVIAGDGDEYTIQPAANETELKALQAKHERILVTIRGDIKQLNSESETLYEIKPGATINSVVQYEESVIARQWVPGLQMMTVQKKSSADADFVEIAGVGSLSIPNFPFMQGRFSIELIDGENYQLEADDDEESIVIVWDDIRWMQVIQQMSFFPVKIKHVVLGEDRVSFGGTLSLNFKAMGDSDDDDDDDDDEDNPDGSDGGSRDDDDDDDDDEDEEEEPLTISLDLDEARYGLRDDGTFGFLGLNAEGEVGMPEEFIPGLDFGAKARMAIDTIDHVYEIETEVSFQFIEVEGLLTIRFTDSMIPIPDHLVFVVGGEPGVPLIPTKPVAYITKGGGGFKNLYDTVVGDFEVLPPLKLVIIGSLDIAKVFTADTMTLEASPRGIEFEGKFKVMKLDIIERLYGSFLVEDTLSKLAVAIQIGAELGIFDIIVGEVYAAISMDSSTNSILGPFSMRGGGEVALQIPESVKLIGGHKLAKVGAEVGTKGVFAEARILRFPVEIEYKWGDRAPTFRIEEASAVSLVSHANSLMGKQEGLMTQSLIEESGETIGTLTYGTNIHRVSSSGDTRLVMNQSPSNVGAYQSFDLIAAANTEHKITIGEQDYALLEFSYEGQLPDIEVRDPNNEIYELELDENYLIQEIPADISASGKLEQRIFVSIVDPLSGQWTVNASRPVEYVLYDVKESAKLKELHIQKNATGAYEVEWELQHATGDEQIALYLTTDNITDPGVLIEDYIDASLGAATFTLPDYQQSGDYYVKAVLYNDARSLNSRYSIESLHVDNEHEPEAPVHVQTDPLGEGMLQVNWEQHTPVDGFLLSLLDEEGQPIETAGEIVLSGDKRSAVIGGLYEAQSGELIGMVPGQTYIVSITPFKEVEGVKVFGAAAESIATLIPEPNPAQLDISAAAIAGQMTIDEDELGEFYRVNAASVMLTVEADQKVEATLAINEEPVQKLSAGTSWTKEIMLQEGMNVIRVLAVNGQGDHTQGAIRVVSDTIAPDLKIESPGAAYLSTDGSIEVRGVSEPGSKVTINSIPVKTDSTGHFIQELSMDGHMSRTLTIVAEDAAGNITEHEIFAANQGIEAIQRVEIIPQPELSMMAMETEDSTHQMKVGEHQKFEVIGYDLLNNAYKIESENVEWEFLLGSEYGVLEEDGTLHADRAGEMVIKAAYHLSDDYALEAAMIVQAKQTDGDSEKPSDYEDWYVEPDRERGSKKRSVATSVDDALEQLLKSIIEAEQGAEYVMSIPLVTGHETAAQIDEYASLFIHAQEWGEQAGIGIGKVRQTSQYEYRPLNIIGDIYEIRMNQVAEFDELPELTIRISLEDVKDVHKLGLYWYNDREERWELLSSSFDVLESGIKAKLPHLGKFALIENEAMRRFTDMADRWSRDLVYRLASIGVIDGVERDGSFVYQPTRSITRQEFAKLMTEISGLSLTDSSLTQTFADIGEVSNWADPYVSTAVERGWISGSTDGDNLLLQPNREITRAEAAVMVARMLEGVLDSAELAGLAGSAGLAGDSTGDFGHEFQDAEQIPAWAAAAVEQLYAAGILNGYPDGTFRPSATISREECAAIFVNLIDFLYRNGRSIS